ncbi:hypothetical protein V8U11_06015 [Pseudomonas chlororaphis]|uniref:SpaN/EivJ family type III secretion system needle length determinant n=1 Tax=Pseudomonas chlororaphis TaxID=587753 RepID=UPI0030CAC787
MSPKHTWITPEQGREPERNAGSESSSYLQVPFAKGDAKGLVNVSKAGADQPDQLLLSPSNASIFNHLSDSLALSPDPRWRLTDHQEHEGHSGHDQGRADEETKEGGDQASRDKRRHGRQDS